jgi:hypothetical protein
VPWSGRVKVDVVYLMPIRRAAVRALFLTLTVRLERLISHNRLAIRGFSVFAPSILDTTISRSEHLVKEGLLERDLCPYVPDSMLTSRLYSSNKYRHGLDLYTVGLQTPNLVTLKAMFCKQSTAMSIKLD